MADRRDQKIVTGNSRGNSTCAKGGTRTGANGNKSSTASSTKSNSAAIGKSSVAGSGKSSVGAVLRPTARVVVVVEVATGAPRLAVRLAAPVALLLALRRVTPAVVERLARAVVGPAAQVEVGPAGLAVVVLVVAVAGSLVVAVAVARGLVVEENEPHIYIRLKNTRSNLVMKNLKAHNSFMFHYYQHQQLPVIGKM